MDLRNAEIAAFDLFVIWFWRAINLILSTKSYGYCQRLLAVGLWDNNERSYYGDRSRKDYSSLFNVSVCVRWGILTGKENLLCFQLHDDRLALGEALKSGAVMLWVCE